jgi:PAS domain S-box-containing protein/putative nucleotidyltransferase with HDIG domain
VRYFSPSAEKMFDYSVQEMLGKNLHHLFVPEDLKKDFEKGFAHFQKTGQGKMIGKPIELTAKHRDGHQFPIELIASPIPRKEGFWAIATIRDISKRKHLERRLAQKMESLVILGKTARWLAKLPDDFEAMAQAVVKKSVERFGLLFAWLGWAEIDGSVSAVAWYPESITYPAEITVRWDDSSLAQGPTGRAIKTGEPQISAKIEIDPSFSPWKEKALQAGVKSSAAFPLLSRGRVLGALNLYSSKENFFTEEKVSLIQDFAHIVATALEKARLFKELDQRIKRLSVLHSIDLAIAGSLDFRIVSRVIFDEVVAHAEAGAASLAVLEPHTRELKVVGTWGFSTKVKDARIPLEDQTASRVIRERKTIHIPDLAKLDEKATSRYQLFKKEGFTSYWGVPLVSKGSVLGVLEVFFRNPRDSNRDWLDFLETLANQTAIALENARLIEEVRTQHDQLLKAYDETIEGWAMALSLKEDETAKHSHRVTWLTVRMAELYGLQGKEPLFVRWGAFLHDIGKIGIPDAILLKPGPLTPSEWKIMKKHPVYAFEMLSKIDYLQKAVDIPYCHHERFDGSGYPRGLRGKEIPLPARFFAVADVWDALTSERPYRKAWSQEDALAHIRAQSGKHFDPQAVELFFEVIAEEETLE